jgi:hypothetical protein
LKRNKILQLFKFRGVFSIFYYIAFLALLWYLIAPHTSFYYLNNIYTPFTKRLSDEDVTLIKGEEYKLSLSNINKRLRFSSTDIKVADVNIFGKVTAYRVGTTIIRVRYQDEILKCRVRVIDINKRKLTLRTGRSSRLDIKGAWFGVRWYSSNSSVVRVNRFGKVTAVSKGRAKIYGKIRGKTLTCIVIVR